ncbi:MFS transporter [Nonomuraea ferruginea]
MADRVFRPAALGNPRFRLLLPGQVAAVAGEQMFAVAITVSVLQVGGDAVALGLVLAARGVTLVVFLPVGGVWADRLPRQRVLMAAYGLQALLAAALAVTGTFPIWAAAGAVLLSGLAEAFVRPAFNALLQGVLGDHERVSGRSLVSVAIRTGVMAGPAAGAGVITLSGTGAAYGITAMTFAVAVLTLWRAGEPRREPARRASFVQDVRAGCRRGAAAPVGARHSDLLRGQPHVRHRADAGPAAGRDHRRVRLARRVRAGAHLLRGWRPGRAAWSRWRGGRAPPGPWR